MTKRITIEDLRNHKKNKTKFACLTAYDASLSRLMSEAGVELILVGEKVKDDWLLRVNYLLVVWSCSN